MDADTRHMRMALALAATGLGRTAPNPTVGCVIIKDGAVLGAARTGDGGRPHAEELALAQAGQAAAGAVAYVTLEPCARRSSGAHSCAALLIAARVARVAAAIEDPHPNASGAGFEALRAAGIVVEAGVLRAEARGLNAGFFRVVAEGLPLLAIDADPNAYDAAFAPAPGEDLEAALRRAARAGLTRLCVTPGTELAARLNGTGLVSPQISAS